MKWMKRIRFLLGPALICLLVCILLKTVLFLGYVPSASMEPMIASGSFILGTRLFGELERGDVVIFFQNGRCLVKRIAAVPGDSVAINDITKEAVVNGDYAAIADRQGNSIYICDKNGRQGIATTLLPITKVAVSAHGVVAAGTGRSRS